MSIELLSEAEVTTLLLHNNLKYTVKSFIGRGAFGQVWLLQDEALGRNVAIKIMTKESLQNSWSRELSGVQLYSQSIGSHPNLVTIYHAGEDGEYFFYIMEAADNIGTNSDYKADTLSSRIAAQNITETQVPQLMQELCNALKALHQKNLLHRDIKPGNIIFVDGALKIMDMGSVTDSAEPSIMGTPGFFPKFDTLPTNDSVDHDLYSAGMVFYMLMTNHAPEAFPSLPRNFLKTAQHQKANRFFMRSCAAEPELRFHSISDFEVALAEVFAKPSSKRWYIAGAILFALILGLGYCFFNIDTPTSSPANIRTINVDSELLFGKDYFAKWQVSERDFYYSSMLINCIEPPLSDYTSIAFELTGDMSDLAFGVGFYNLGDEDKIQSEQLWGQIPMTRLHFNINSGFCTMGTVYYGATPYFHELYTLPKQLFSDYKTTNHLIKRGENSISYYLNGQLILKVTDSRSLGNRMFFYTKGYSAGDFYIKNLDISSFEP